MKDEEFEALMRDAARTYNRPLELPRSEALWTAIERSLPEAGERPMLAVVRDTGDIPRVAPAAPPVTSTRRAPWWTNGWLRTAAVLLLGVAIGRVSVRQATFDQSVRATASSTIARPDLPRVDQGTTTAYLGQTAALLTALPGELRGSQTDPSYITRADALLLQTRLLLDSPAASDPALRSLFDDLELVLAQVVRLKADRDQTRIDLLNQSLEQRDVLPRLREAVAENAAD